MMTMQKDDESSSASVGSDHGDPREEGRQEEENEEENSSLNEEEENEVDDADDGKEPEINNDGEDPPEKKKKVHKLSMKKTEDFNETLKKRGVIYVARIPPRMTPTKLKTILSDFGEVTRVFCQEEDAAKRKRRRKATGNGSKRYVEGWVEYASKKVAKRVAAALHQQQISNVKRNPHYGDLWNLKYLPKFQWSHLTEKVAYERRVREQKIRLETMHARRETASYKKLLETGLKLDKIEERKRKRDGVVEVPKQKKHQSSFQVKPMDDGANNASNKALLGSLV